jgi:IS5 family transposase
MTGAPAKPARLAFGALFIKQRLGLTDEETVEQIRKNPYPQFFHVISGYSTKAPFDPSMMVHFRKVQPSRRIVIFRGRSQSDQ